MLARTFKSAAELNLQENEYQALLAVLYGMEDGSITEDNFVWGAWHYSCGTAHCIAGWAHTLDPTAFPELRPVKNGIPSDACTYLMMKRLPEQCQNLFYAKSGGTARAIAYLRKYLETGESKRW